MSQALCSSGEEKASTLPRAEASRFLFLFDGVSGGLCGAAEGISSPGGTAIPVNRIKKHTEELLKNHKSEFGLSFEENKKTLERLSTIRYKILKNEIAGYITNQNKKEAEKARREAERERSNSRQAEPEPEPKKSSGDFTVGIGGIRKWTGETPPEATPVSYKPADDPADDPATV
ncbi:ribosomal protein S17E [Cenarchaeum symbiosum A]|uniref:Small ribosomal subunit protein eS17 n=1 Tax=Cenarchaeum symbiosum (strain A) TaxID=414004 RepID=A0RTT2_CENSY|nr:ribosomal protein S17E [Cenarchaeum symbiosum A]